MKCFFIFLFIIIFNFPLCAFQPYRPIGASALSTGGISILPSSFWSVFNNQAGLAEQTNWGFGFAYDNYLGLDTKLSMKSVGLIAPTKSGTFALNANYFGYSGYNEQKIGFAYGKALGKNIAVGLQFDYFSQAIGADYGRAHAFSFEIGVLAKLSESLQLATHIFNPFMVKLGNENPEKIAAILKFGLAYKIDKSILLLSEYEQSIDDHGIIKLGVEYLLIENFCVRLGISNHTNSFSFGAGLKLKGLNIDIGSSYHQTLGFSPNIGIHYIIY